MVIPLHVHPEYRADALSRIAAIAAGREGLSDSETEELEGAARAMSFAGHSAGRVAGAVYSHMRRRRSRRPPAPGAA